MKRIAQFTILLLATIIIIAQAHTLPDAISYIYPSPGSRFIAQEAMILLRLQPELRSHLAQIQFQITGDKNGNYTASTVFSDDGKTLIIQPDRTFQPEENITVTLSSPAFSTLYSFQFSVSLLSSDDKMQISKEMREQPEQLAKVQQIEGIGKVTTINGVTVPSNFPRITISEFQEDKVAPGLIFTGLRQNYIMILKNDGTPYYYRKSNDFITDLKVQNETRLSRIVDDWSTGVRHYIVMDTAFCSLDSFWVHNGYETDHHDFQLLPDGHVLMIAGDYQPIDMSKIVAGGKAHATVRGCHIQEQDSNHNIVFQWDCWENIPLTDAVYEDLTEASIDYMHMNSVELDYDGNIIASCRNTSECIKVNRQTGELMWVLGGVQNSFYFTNDLDQNSYQHFFRSVPDHPNHYMIFDNGNTHRPHYTRGVEFKLDTENWTAERVWEHRHSPDIQTSWLGSVQRLPNGNTLINWANSKNPFAYEVTPDGEIVYDAANPDGYHCYRSYRFDWQGQADKPYLLLENMENRLILIFNLFGEEKPDHYKIFAGTDPHNLALIDTTSQTRYDFVELENKTRYYFQTIAVMSDGSESNASNVVDAVASFQFYETNLVQNGDFNRGSKEWNFESNGGASARGFARNNEYVVEIDNGGSSISNIQVIQPDIALFEGSTYRFEFDAWASTSRIIEAKVAQAESPWINYGRIGFTALSTRKQHFSYEFVMQDYSDTRARIVINCGIDDADIYMDNVSLTRLNPALVADAQPILDFHLAPAFPNPFNSQTRVQYTLPKNSFVQLDIYDIRGQHVSTLVKSHKASGMHVVTWNGKNDAGTSVAGGIYFCHLHCGDITQTRKITLVQ